MKSRLSNVAPGVAAVTALALIGAAIAGAAGAFSGSGGPSIPDSQAQRAKRAALTAVGGGSVTGLERDSEDGATYEVEVTKPDGSVVDVRLDGSYGVVKVDGDAESADSPDTNDSSEPSGG